MSALTSGRLIFTSLAMMLLMTIVHVVPAFSQTIRNIEVLQRAEIQANQPVNILVRRDEQMQMVQQPLSTFQLPVNANIATVKGAGRIKYETQGKYLDHNQMTTMKGRLLDDIYICRIVGESAPVALQILVDTTTTMLQYNQDERMFEGRLNLILLDDSPGQLQSRQLVEPVLVEVSSAGGARVTPENTSISHTNLPSTVIEIHDRSPQNRVPVNIKTAFNPQGQLQLLKKQSLLRIETPSKKIQGYGVEAIPIRIQVLGNSAGSPVNVNIVTDKGTVEPDNVDIEGDRGATVILRSSGTGEATITISAAGFESESRNFRYVFPLMFIVFSVIGGLLGAFVKYFMKKGKKDLKKTVLLGLITGFIVAILYYVLGIQLFSFKLNNNINEFAVLGLGFLGALLWDSIYALLSKSNAKP